MALKASKAIPEGMHTVTPSLWFNGNCKEAIDFYIKTLNAQLMGQIAYAPDGKSIWHAMLKIGDSPIMLGDAMPGGWERGPKGSSTMGIWLYVEDCDAVFIKAIGNGCETLMSLTDAFWGDRMGKFKDPFGHCWSVATHQWIYTPKEMKTKEKEMLSQSIH